MVKKILGLLTNKQKANIWIILFTIFLKTILDLIGITIIIPFLLLLLNKGDISSIPTIGKYLQQIYTSLNFSSYSNFFAFLIIGLIFLLALKGFINILIARYQNRYVLNIYQYFSKQLYLSYYNKGYQFVKNNNVSDFAYRINTICYSFCLNIIMQIISLIAEGLIIFSMIIILLAKSPFSAGVLLISILPSMLIYTLLIKKRIKKYGEKEIRARVDLMQTITDTFKGYPDIVIGNAFPLMRKRLNNNMDIISSNRIKYATVTSIPGVLMEISLVLCIGTLIIYSGISNSNINLTLALFGVAAIKIIPAVKGIISSWTTIKNSSYSIDIIYEGLANFKEEKQEEIIKNPEFSEIQISNLSYSFPDRDIVLNNFSLNIKQGEKIGIKGESGIGKSTLYNIILGLFPNWEKHIKILDKNGDNISLLQWQKIIGYVPQHVYIFNNSIAENIAIEENFNINREQKIYIKEILKGENPNIHFNIPPEIKKRIDWCIDKAQLREFVNTLPDGIFTTIGDAGSKLSGGQIQRIGIARALYKSPQVLFFDEATSSLDSKTEKEINLSIEEIAGENKDLTIVIIAHRESTLKICDRIVSLN